MGVGNSITSSNKNSPAAMDAHAAGLCAEILLAPPAHHAFAASHPRRDQPHIANACPLRLGAGCNNLADILVSHRQRQLHATILKPELLPASDIVVAVPDVEV